MCFSQESPQGREGVTGCSLGGVPSSGRGARVQLQGHPPRPLPLTLGGPSRDCRNTGACPSTLSSPPPRRFLLAQLPQGTANRSHSGGLREGDLAPFPWEATPTSAPRLGQDWGGAPPGTSGAAPPHCTSSPPTPSRAGACGWWETLCVTPGTSGSPHQGPPRRLQGAWPRGAGREWPTSHRLPRSPLSHQSPARGALPASPWSVRSPQRLVTNCICPSPSGPGPSRPGVAR